MTEAERKRLVGEIVEMAMKEPIARSIIERGAPLQEYMDDELENTHATLTDLTSESRRG